MNNGDEPAYPMDYTKQQTHGLTKRELIAAMLMQGLMTHPNSHERPITIARHSVHATDVLLNALKEPK